MEKITTQPQGRIYQYEEKKEQAAKREEEKALEIGKLISIIGRTLSLLIVVLAILSRGRKGVDFKIEEITFLFLHW